ncbi:hypothetical protein BH10ACI2_BH10ACI2_04420 [soil metagenome]
MDTQIENLKLFTLRQLIRLHWWCERQLVNTPFRTRENILYDPISTGTIISLIIAGASFGANLVISHFLAPKQKGQVKGKLTGDITLTDSILGAPVPRVYGGRPADGSAGGCEVGCNIHWMSEIRKTETTTPGDTGGGGKGGPKPPPNITVNYKVDLAGIVGMGKLRLLRMKWNEDTVYSVNGNGSTVTGTGYQAEAGGNTKTGTAANTADAACSGGSKVTGIGSGSGNTLTINSIYGDATTPPTRTEDEGKTPFFSIDVKYKCSADRTCTVELDGDGGEYFFPTAATTPGTINILREMPSGTTSHTLKFSNLTAAAPDIDWILVSVEWYDLGLGDPFGPSGVRNASYPVEKPQDNILLPNPQKTDTNAFERYNASTPTAVYGAFEIPLVNGASLAWYEGSEDQPVDAVIDANLTSLYGAGSTPAFLGTAYFRIQNLDFTDYGSIPAIRVVVENIDLQSVSEILINEAVAVGLDESDLDLTAADSMHCRGFFIQDIEAPAKAFEDLGLVFNLGSAETHAGQIKAVDPTDRTIAATISANEMGAYVAGDSNEVPLDDVVSVVPEESEDLIRVLELQFNNPLAPSDYATDRKAFNYPFTASQKKEAKSVNVTMLPEEAAAVVARELQKHHLQQAPDTLITTHRFAYVSPGECLSVEIDGSYHTRRIAEKSGSAPGTYEITLLNEDIFVMADATTLVDAAITEQSLTAPKSITIFPANTVGTLLDIPAVIDNHDGLVGVYVAACSKGNGDWQGCQVYRQRAGEYLPLTTLTTQASMGVTTAAPASVAGGAVSGDLDTSASLSVDFYGDFNPSTVTTGQAQDGANPFVIGGEICIVKTWTRNNSYPNRWVGTNIYRMLKHTEKYGTGHVSGERVVLLNDAVKFVALDEDEVGVARNWKFVTYRAHVDDAAIVAFTWGGDNQYNREKTAPAFGQAANAGVLAVSVGVSDYTDNARYRKVEYSDYADMHSSTESVIVADDFPFSVLPTAVVLTRPTDTGNVTKYVRVSHSSNGRDFGTPSSILPVVFATGSGTGGSTGSYDPDPPPDIPVY